MATLTYLKRACCVAMLASPASLALGQAATSGPNASRGDNPAQLSQPSSLPAADSPLSAAPAPPNATPLNPTLQRQFDAAGAASSTATREQAESNRLADAPEMFGDSMQIVGLSAVAITFGIGSDFAEATTNVAVPVGNFGVKVSDQNSPFPHDRISYRYSYFTDVATQATNINGSFINQNFNAQNSLSVHTVAVEKTFFDNWCSIELRAPVAQRKSFTETFVAGDFNVDESVTYGGWGNLFLVSKVLLYRGEELAIAGGMAVESPTGQDAILAFDGSAFARYHNRAVYLHPYVAALLTPTDRWFHQAWVGVTVPVGPNQFQVLSAPGVSGTQTIEEAFQINQQTLMTFDALTGFWLFRDRSDLWIDGLAPIFEVHYVGALDQPQFVEQSASFFSSTSAIASPYGSFQVVNLTSALHAQLTPSWSARVGVIVPVADQLFTNEFSFQTLYRF